MTTGQTTTQKKRKTPQDTALRKLRWRFALINAVSILAVLALVVVAIYGITRSRIEQQGRTYLRMHTELMVRQLEDATGEEKQTEWRPENDLPGENASRGIAEQGGIPNPYKPSEARQGDGSAKKERNDPPRVHDGFFALQDIFRSSDPNRQRWGSAVLLLDQEGTVLQVLTGEPLSEENQAARLQMARTALDSGKEYLQISLDGESYMLRITPYSGQEEGSYLLAYLSTSGDFTALSSLLRACITVAIPVFIVVLLISVFLASRAMRPMVDAWQKQKDFVADAAHELRTPIAVIRANADVLGLHPEKTVGSQQKWLKYIREDTQRMETLVNELLYLANTDVSGPAALSYPVDMSKLLREAVMSSEPLFFERGLELETEIVDHLSIAGDQARMQKLISVFLDNMLRHSTLPGKGSIRADLQSGRVTVRFANDCPPLTQENLAHLFDRFYRSDPSRQHGENDDTGGYGLGLSIAQRLVSDSGGRISVDQLGGQIVFTLSWPQARREKQGK